MVSSGRLLSLQLLIAVISVLVWHLLTTVPIGGITLLPPFFFSNPVDVAARIVKWFADGTIWKHLWITLIEAMLAFVIGSVAGVLIGFWFAQQPRGAAVFDPSEIGRASCSGWCYIRWVGAYMPESEFCQL